MFNLLKLAFFPFCVYLFLLISCDSISLAEKNKDVLLPLLKDPTLTIENKYSILNQISNSYLQEGQKEEAILFLTDYIEKNPDDPYNAYWLLMIAHIYLQSETPSIAEYYFDRIIQNYDDLLIQNQSIHILCLQNLIKISKSAENRAFYFSTLINNFPEQVNITELYMRLAMEYENLGEWEQAMNTYQLFLDRPDATTIRIAGVQDPYTTARKLIDFNNSPKDWTYATLDDLENAVKKAISQYNPQKLDSIKSKVNFFGMSWKQDVSDENSQKEFSLRGYMKGNRIRYDSELDESSNANEAYLKTTGWTTSVKIWYLYFKKVNFPPDPDIHGRWEWAGIYFGEKL